VEEVEGSEEDEVENFCLKHSDVRGGRDGCRTRFPEDSGKVISDDEPDTFLAVWSTESNCAQGTGEAGVGEGV
jgi:hypothetical protein